MEKPQRTYRSFLIRLWWAENAGNPLWRVEVEEPGNETRMQFDEVALLCQFLQMHFTEHHDDSQSSPKLPEHSSPIEGVNEDEHCKCPLPRNA